MPWPENQQFYYGEEKDVWSEHLKGSIHMSKKRKADEAELDMLQNTVGKALPWKQTAPTPTPSVKKIKTEEHTGGMQELPSPSPSPSPTKYPAMGGHAEKQQLSAQTELAMDKEEYDKKMGAVVLLIHKVSGEWHRKGKEFNIAVAKSSTNPLTKGSAVEAALKAKIKEAAALVMEMEHVETCYVTNIPVTEQQQREVKKAAEDVYEKIKAGNKLKCLTWGCDGGPSCRRLRRLPTHNVFEGVGVRCVSHMYAHTTKYL